MSAFLIHAAECQDTSLPSKSYRTFPDPCPGRLNAIKGVGFRITV